MDVNHRIREIFDGAVDLPRDHRPAFLHEQCGGDRALYDEVAKLVDAYESSVESEADLAIGRLIGFGAYEIVRELGRGGMGAVYLARRVDGTFDRQVAVKVVRADKIADTALERFTRERRLLARLQHPGIATLYDAGSTEDGMPYFVMEYVDGLGVGEYADRKRLDLRSRVALFRRICDAVAAAHRVPIVHCDLKPANILVDADGQPRVLDFGIATALTRGGQEADPPLDPYGSPRYASPEQMRGEPLQTTSDIYSLGVILHELLVGQPPAPDEERTGTSPVKPSALFAVGDDATPRVAEPDRVAGLRNTTPEALGGALAGDLDAILAKCLQPAPEQRYATVDALDDDLQRWLDRRPVGARAQTAGYVASRFVQRNPALTVMSALVALLLIAGIVIVTYQWRQADAARRLAERRFNDVRGLATSLFDVDSALTRVVGTTEARRTIVENANQYLDRLAGDVHDDPVLSLELAESYRRVGDMYGNPNVPNLGERPQALQKYDIAARHVAAAARRRPDDPAVRLADARVRSSRADVLLAQRAFANARQEYEASASIVLALLNQDPNSVALRRMLAGIYRPLGDLFLADGNSGEALASYEKARALDLAMLAGSSGDAESQRLLALSELRVAEALAAREQLAQAVDTFDQAFTRLGSIAAADPARISVERDIAVGRMELARLLDEGAGARAHDEMRRSLDVFRTLARVDARNARAQRDLLVALVANGDIAARTDAAAARASYQEALTLAEMLHADPFQDAQAERDITLVRARLFEPPARQRDVELKLAVLRNGAEVTVGTGVTPPAVGEDVQLSWPPAGGNAQYLLVLGGSGRANLFARDEIAAAGWRVKASGPPPSETLLLLTVPRSLGEAERTALLDRVSRIPGPRQLPLDSHIRWRSHQPEVIETPVTPRGVVEIDWATVLRTELERFPGLRFSGRTFPLASR